MAHRRRHAAGVRRLSQPLGAPDFYKALAQVERLLPAYRGRAVLTRYVPPKALTGA